MASEDNTSPVRQNKVDDLLQRACDLLGADASVESRCGKEIASDGSTRIFLRMSLGDKSVVLAAPGLTTATELAEAHSAWQIGRHLSDVGCAVPEIHGFDADVGMLIFEDLGDTRLYDVVSINQGEGGGDHAFLQHWYEKAIDALIHLQVEGGKGFRSEWCWDTPKYDLSLMLEKETGYFLRAFWQDLLGQDIPAVVSEEFAAIAAEAATADTGYFLHRDCQSRNIMVVDDTMKFIDFQGGRLGPLGYDLASLLIDPYVGLSRDVQDSLLSYYRRNLGKRGVAAGAEFEKFFQFLAVQRNLQIIGAFSFLSAKRGKPFFRSFIEPAVRSLAVRLDHSVFGDYHHVKNLVGTASSLLQKF